MKPTAQTVDEIMEGFDMWTLCCRGFEARAWKETWWFCQNPYGGMATLLFRRKH